MKNKTLTVSIFTLFALTLFTATALFLSGCAGGGTSEKKTVGTAYIGGTGGLIMAFMEGSPPAEVYDKGTYPFDVSVKLENKGEYNAPRQKVKVKILGIDPLEFGNPVMEKNPDEDLSGTHLGPEGEIVPGTVSYLTFSNFNYQGIVGARQQLPLRADICYEYGTSSQSMLCIRQNVLSTVETICKVNEAKKSESSASPIQIVNFQENTAGKDKLTFSFIVEHRGIGAIYSLENYCDDSPVNRNKVWVKVEVRDMQPGLSCAGLEGGTTEGYVRLEEGKRSVRCTLSTASVSGDFEKAIYVSAKFNYKEHIDKFLLVKPSMS